MNVAVRWIILNDAESLTFLNKDVIVAHNNIHILFHNLTTNSELIYTAQDDESGDGVQCFIGHKHLYMFAFAEKSNHARIFMKNYPDFKTITKIKDNEMKKFVALELLEGEYIVALGIEPVCKLIVWCWRSEQKLISFNFEVESLRHTLGSSVMSSFFYHCWNTNFCIWEIIPTYKSCLLHNRVLYKENINIVDVAWTNDGCLYAIDEGCNFYSIAIDGVNLISTVEWSAPVLTEPFDSQRPILAFYQNGFVIFGTQLVIKHLRKINKDWFVNWTYELESPVLKMVSSGNGENLVFMTSCGEVMKMQYENDRVISNIVTIWQRELTFVDFVYPNVDEIITLHSNNTVCLWKCNTGMLNSRIQFEDRIFYMKCSPAESLVALSCGFDEKYGVCFMQLDKDLQKTATKCLTTNCINKIVWSNTEKELLVSAMSAGEIFHLKISGDWCVNVIHYLTVNEIVCDFWISTINDRLLYIASIKSDTMLLCYDCMDNKIININCKDVYTDQIMCFNDNFVLMSNQDIPQKLIFYELLYNDGGIDLKWFTDIISNTEITGIFVQNITSHLTLWDYNSFNVIQVFPSVNNIHKVVPCHRFGGKLKMVLTDLHNKIAISLTECGNLTMYSFNKQIEARQSGKFEITYKNCHLNFVKILKLFDEKTEVWILEKIREDERKENVEWSEKRSGIFHRYNVIREKLSILLEENEKVDIMYRLPLEFFRMCSEAYQKLCDDAAAERQNLKITFENQIKTQDQITEWIKSVCWHSMEVVGKELRPFFSKISVENYSIPPIETSTDIVKESCDNIKFLEAEKEDLLLLRWKKLIDIRNLPHFELRQASSNLSLAIEINTSSKPKDCDEAPYDLIESTATQFVDGEEFICSQMLLHSFLQMNWHKYKTQRTTYNLQMHFNKKFEEILKLKQEKISSVLAGNKRLKVIVSELNILNKLKGIDGVMHFFVEDPQWSQEEVPEKLITVEPHEVSISPYISLSDIAKSTSEINSKDPFYEEALVDMMDGTLEKLWEEEIKKSIPEPQCMIDKNPEEFTETDLIDIAEWKERKKNQEIEREKYYNILCSEYDKLSSVLNEKIINFNRRIDGIYLLKLKIESAIGQEELKTMLMRVHSLDRIEAAEKYRELECEMMQLENEQEHVYGEVNLVQNQTAECHTAYELLASRDRMLDKNFKTNLGDVSPMALDLCYKLFKKRPKWHTKPSMTVGVLYEMAVASLSKERSPFLHHDCLDYLKGIDHMDSINNMPSTIDEFVWGTLCRIRRAKIENEIKMRAAAAEIIEVEAAYSSSQKRMNAFRVHHQKLKTDITNHRSHMEKQIRNIPMQFIIKSGLIEIEMTGHLEDFDEAILVKQEEVEAINKQIRKAAQMKVKAERATSKFRKKILDKEWEHATLKMKLKQLEDDLNYFERIKVTKEIQSFIQDKAQRFIKVDVEKKAQLTKLHFDKQLLDLMQEVEELELKVGSINSQILSLENLINRLKKNIAEVQERENSSGKATKQQDITRRINLFISRNKLINEIQKQHSTIILLQTELELQRLRTYPTLSILQSFS